MAESRSLFNVLLGQPWWISALVGAGLFGIAQYVGYRQLRTVSPGKVDERLQALREMSWEQFSVVVAAAYRRNGYDVAPTNKSAFDFVLTKQGRATLLQCRRWKVKQLGIGPLDDLAKAISGEDAHNAICISAGDFTPQAREFVAAKPISLVQVGNVAKGK
jgi:restriction system protein